MLAVDEKQQRCLEQFSRNKKYFFHAVCGHDEKKIRQKTSQSASKEREFTSSTALNIGGNGENCEKEISHENKALE